MGTYTFLDLAAEALAASQGPLDRIDLWKRAEDLGLTRKLLSRGKTPQETLGARLYMDVRDNPRRNSSRLTAVRRNSGSKGGRFLRPSMLRAHLSEMMRPTSNRRAVGNPEMSSGTLKVRCIRWSLILPARSWAVCA